MRFIKSIADSLFSPTELRGYNTKSPIRVILYVLFLGILLVIPHVIMSINVGTITYETKVQIRNYFKYDVDEFPLEIIDGKLVSNDDDFTYTKKITSSLSVFAGTSFPTESEEVKDSSQLYIAFLEDGIYLNNVMTTIKLVDYDDYDELKNLKFDGAFNDDLNFWNKIFKVYGEVYSGFRPIFITIYIGFAFFQGLFIVTLFSLLVTWFNRLGSAHLFKFTAQWKITIYGMTGFVLGNVFSTMFSMNIIYYIGIIWSLVICIKSTQVYERGDNNEL